MKILFIGSVFAKENESEIIQKSKVAVEYSANIFQKKLIEGLKKSNEPFEVVSAPGIGSFPNAYKDITFKGFKETQNEYQYVKFNNIWGIRNYSRSRAIKRALIHFIKEKNDSKLIIVYSVHTPFLAAAAYAKRKDPSIKICLIVPDLPQYMNLNEKQSFLYKIGKKFDISKFYKLTKWVDSYILLAEAMKDKLNIEGKPYRVVEGIVTEEELYESQLCRGRINKNKEEKLIVYTGKLYRKFGVGNLVDAFLLTKDPQYRLVLCGNGDMVSYIENAAEKDNRILFKGQVSATEAKEWIYKADVLVNPRQNNEEYTKYSFPSKIIEYLLSGNPVVAYMLNGMPKVYHNFVYLPKNSTKEALKEIIIDTLERKNCKKNFFEYALKNLSAEYIIKQIIGK